ncbi:homeodomain-interacting protein kinase 1-like isoform X2 [Notolabrus celidotus]|uniref:homeodomain-interacting protein kinase 1-like isoform X2 n=1 Tax=Notolabrus celidotus TaxID=1203425 RepID=UPI00148FE8D9|nr:homeodomain-interacting protein kinase 1-like isoform X2 [Notolabrus celidotus]
MSADTVNTPEFHPGDTLHSSSAVYSIMDFIGEEVFGKVAKCWRLDTKKIVVIKILKDDPALLQDSETEESILKYVSVLNADSHNLVRFFEKFQFMGQMCLVFEMLDMNLFDLLKETDWKPLSLPAIRPIAQQLLVALAALKGLNILHMDIKPDNVTLVHTDLPVRVRLIDFGSAITADQVQRGLVVQSIGYRAPEISLGLPYTEAIDVWGVGCILACLFLSDNLFPVHCEYLMMKYIVEILGQPEDQLLQAGMYTQCFFIEEEAAAKGSSWRFMTPEEFTVANNVQPEEPVEHPNLPSSLNALVHMFPPESHAELRDRVLFVDLLKGLLHLDGDQRMTASQGLQHPFITMSHLDSGSDYLINSRDMMGISQKPDQESGSGSSGLFPGSANDDQPSSSLAGDTDLVAEDDSNSTGSSNGVSAIPSYEAGLVTVGSFDGGLSSPPGDEDEADLSPEYEADLSSEDEADLSSEGEADLSSEDEADLSSEDEADLSPEDEADLSPEDEADLSSEGEADLSPEDEADLSPEDEADLSPENEADLSPEDEADLSPEDEADLSPEDEADLSPEDEADLSPENEADLSPEDEADLSPEGAAQTDSSASVSASPGCMKKMRKRLRRFFRRVAASLCCGCQTEE